MRRALRKRWPALTQFTFGALTPLTVGRFTLGEINEYLHALNQAEEDRRGER